MGSDMICDRCKAPMSYSHTTTEKFEDYDIYVCIVCGHKTKYREPIVDMY